MQIQSLFLTAIISSLLSQRVSVLICSLVRILSQIFRCVRFVSSTFCGFPHILFFLPGARCSVWPPAFSQ